MTSQNKKGKIWKSQAIFIIRYKF